MKHEKFNKFKPWFHIATCALIILAIWYLFSGCAGRTVNPVCRHDAIYAALTWADLTGEQTMIAVGPSNIHGLPHAQAVVITPSGIPEYLVVGNGMIGIGEKDWWFEPDVFFTTDQFINLYFNQQNQSLGQGQPRR